MAALGGLVTCGSLVIVGLMTVKDGTDKSISLCFPSNTYFYLHDCMAFLKI